MKVKLAEDQLNKFKELWFVYGNSGKKSTLGNHKLIQNFIEHSENNIEFYREGNINMTERHGQEFANKNGVTEECIEQCLLIINEKSV